MVVSGSSGAAAAVNGWSRTAALPQKVRGNGARAQQQHHGRRSRTVNALVGLLVSQCGKEHMDDVMLDLETMGNGPNAAIVSVGAIEFDATTNTLGQQFYRVVHLETAVADGGVIDASTVMWWMRQSDDARKDICGDGLPVRQVLAEFATWLSTLGEDVSVWGNGAAFDNVILAQAYRRAGMPVPWSHRNDRCYRTVKAMRPDVKMERTGTHHNALHDATSQATHMMAIIQANAIADQTATAGMVRRDVGCCGGCAHFDSEDISGAGWCAAADHATACGDRCLDYHDNYFTPNKAICETGE